MLVQKQVGPVSTTTSISAGVLVPGRTGNMGEDIVSELHGRYYEAAYRRSIFSGASLGQTTSVGLATAVVGLTLTNPIGSPVNLVVNKFGFSFIVAFAAASTVGLAVGYNAATAVTQTTPVTPKNNFVGVGATGTGLLASTATVPTAATVQLIAAAGLTGAITTVPYIAPTVIDLEGSIVLPPGGYLCTYTSTASGAAGANFSFQWEEVPV
jgi:hypothetical protein